MNEITAKEQLEHIRVQRNEMTRRRRKREKQWLIENGYTSWESLHTKLMKGEIQIKEAKKVKPLT